jgi:fructosamine-3-kinase
LYFSKSIFSLIPHFITQIANVCGIVITGFERVYGGDINEAWQLQSTGPRYFLKLNEAERFPGMFAMEAAGLQAIRNNSSMIVPHTIQYGLLQHKQWLLLQWIEKGSPGTDSLKNFGEALARMHQRPQAYFGWQQHNYIGSLQQVNTHQDNWAAFYTQCRIIPLMKILFDKHIFSKQDLQHAAAFCTASGNLFPQEPPSLLHGDLWAGNYLINADGEAAIYDPAVYFGHREMDIAMTLLFGGFSQSFYDAYNEQYPLQQGWQNRLPLSQLYPLLVHAVLFGGHYIAGAREIISKF